LRHRLSRKRVFLKREIRSLRLGILKELKEYLEGLA
jgi:hypothetical protein